MYSGLSQVCSPMYLTPAYGRKYKTVEEMVAGFNAGHDFSIGPAGPYTSIRDFEMLKEQASTITLVQGFLTATLS